MVIHIHNLIPGADTADQGTQLYPHLKAALDSDKSVVVDFDGVQTATSSFVKTAFVALLESFTLHDLKTKMRIINSTRQINQMIKTRLEREALVNA